ncbi:MAG: TRAP transporter large permease subunit [Bosea sp. (in: a-proteobacteria)]|jgi:tripartite ATP-independent transporter DctM subunit|uniref:TRAP transporter large permease n=1 Tax=Hyphomicrobiales TaxID=356 RepID=UPI0008329BCF|nr:TRAP transporter large permease subunit [Methylobacterium sp. CCH7-A2]MCP4559050.1 TRAP transporter large permease subunit [Bosea sp. (in: a-proteobacteria)]MDX3805031.1 TRAP transporter large permease subunit [Bosea sp. (in: a-proteobacteria)]
MSWQTALLMLLGGVVALLALRVPVAFAFLAVNVVGALFFLGGEMGLLQLTRNAVSSVSSASLTPIPFFVLMGEVLFHTGLAGKAIDAVNRVITGVPGRLAVVVVVAGTIFSAISGSTIATTAILGSLMLPVMLKRGYDPMLALGAILAIGSVDMLIPPSAIAVLLGSLAGISVSKLLLAGILPGFLMSTLIVGYIVLRAWWNPALAPPDDVDLPRGESRWRNLLIYVAPLVFIFTTVVGVLVAGWATPTESAAVGALSTVVAAILYRALTWETLKHSLVATAEISGMILFIILGATTFTQVLGFSGATNGLVGSILGFELSPGALVLAMMAILLFLGLFIDQISIILVTVPFFMPLVQSNGVDPVWFGTLFLIAMQTGLLTPPFGLLLFALKSVSPEGITLQQIAMAALPYVGMCILLLALVFLFPGLATWLPSLL